MPSSPDPRDEPTLEPPASSPNRLREIASAVRKAGEAARATGEETAPAITGVKAFMAGDFDRARRLLLPLAEGGDPHAATLIAKMYFAGNGVPKDAAQYERFLRVAADAGDRTAKAKLKRLARARSADTEAPKTGER